MKSAKNILEKYSSKTPSKWRERAEWRRANRMWLEKSQEIALTLINYIENRGISQKDLAEMLDKSHQYISQILKGAENLSLKTICEIEKALSIEIISVNPIHLFQEVSARPFNQNIAFSSTVKSYKTTSLVFSKVRSNFSDHSKQLQFAS